MYSGVTWSNSSVISELCFNPNISGDGVVIEDSYIWSEVKIESNSSISKSLICDGVIVKRLVEQSILQQPLNSVVRLRCTLPSII